MAVIERKTNTLERSVGFEFNKPIASADLNESQSILLDNVIKFLGGKLTNSTAKITLDDFTDNKPGLTVKGIRYCVVDASGNVFYGYSTPNTMILTYPGTVLANNTYKIFAYWRSVDLTPDSIVYEAGIRANANQPSIVERTTTNNIKDANLNIEVSTRKGLELTFVVVSGSGSAPTLSGWSSGVLIANVTIASDKSSVITNTAPASDIDEHIESLLPHYFMSGNKKYRYGLSVNESTNHMSFNYEEV